MKKLIWLLQIISALILFPAAWAKLSSQMEAIEIFNSLGMEPDGRFLIGLIELGAALALLTRHFAAVGAVLSFGTMLGALIAHTTVLGISALGDGGDKFTMMLILLFSSAIVMSVRRKELPFIGKGL